MPGAWDSEHKRSRAQVAKHDPHVPRMGGYTSGDSVDKCHLGCTGSKRRVPRGMGAVTGVSFLLLRLRVNAYKTNKPFCSSLRRQIPFLFRICWDLFVVTVPYRGSLSCYKSNSSGVRKARLADKSRYQTAPGDNGA
jgi:hypothetical protein